MSGIEEPCGHERLGHPVAIERGKQLIASIGAGAHNIDVGWDPEVRLKQPHQLGVPLGNGRISREDAAVLIEVRRSAVEVGPRRLVRSHLVECEPRPLRHIVTDAQHAPLRARREEQPRS